MSLKDRFELLDRRLRTIDGFASMNLGYVDLGPLDKLTRDPDVKCVELRVQIGASFSATAEQLPHATENALRGALACIYEDFRHIPHQLRMAAYSGRPEKIHELAAEMERIMAGR